MAIAESVSIEIFDILGKSVLTGRIEPDQRLNIDKLESGVYLIKLSGGRQNLKLIKE